MEYPEKSFQPATYGVDYGSELISEFALGALLVVAAASHTGRTGFEEFKGKKVGVVTIKFKAGEVKAGRRMGREGIAVDVMDLVNVLNNNHTCLERVALQVGSAQPGGGRPYEEGAKRLLERVRLVSAAMTPAMRAGVQESIGNIADVDDLILTRISLRGIMGGSIKVNFIRDADDDNFPVLRKVFR
ncbi:MAG: hypothetical protein AAF715_22485 [Myxococcota bacterium]